MDSAHTIGDKIRRMRLLKGMSQEQLALNSGMNVSYLGQIERGTKRNCTLNTLEKIALGLGCSLESIIVFEEQRHHPPIDNNKILTVLTSDDLKKIIIETLTSNKPNHVSNSDCDK